MYRIVYIGRQFEFKAEVDACIIYKSTIIICNQSSTCVAYQLVLLHNPI